MIYLYKSADDLNCYVIVNLKAFTIDACRIVRFAVHYHIIILNFIIYYIKTQTADGDPPSVGTSLNV